MPDIEFVCPGCEQTLEAPAEMAGEVIECPSCQTAMTIPAAEEPMPGEPEEGAEAPDGEQPVCPACGNELAAGAVLCVQCGYHTELGKRISTEFL
jgi:hypothetical protein